MCTIDAPFNDTFCTLLQNFNLWGIKSTDKVIHLQQIQKITPTDGSKYKIGDALHDQSYI